MNNLMKKFCSIESFAYLVVILTFAASLILPFIYKFVCPYAAPTAVYANQIMNSNRLRDSAGQSAINYYDFWKGSTEIEVDYPAPSLSLSIFAILTRIPKEFIIFIPITGVVNIVHFALAKRVLCEGRRNKSYALLISAFYYAYVTFDNISTKYVGRATLGMALLTVFMFFYVKFFYDCTTGRAQRSNWIVLILLVFVLASTYYISTLAIVVLASLMVALMGFFSLFGQAFVKKPLSHAHLTIGTLATFLFLYHPFINSIANKSSERAGSNLLTLFIDNCIQYARSVLGIGIEQSEAWLRTGTIEIDLLTKILRMWLARAITITIVIALIAVLFGYRPRKKLPIQKSFKMIWLFSVVVLFFSISELSYLLTYPFPNPVRFLSMYGFLVLLFVVKRLGIDGLVFRIAHIDKCCDWQKKITVLFLALVIFLSCYGSLRYTWYYGMGSAKPFAYNEVQPLTEFLCKGSSGDTSVVLSGDAYYTANVFFITSLYNKVGNVIPNPLGKDAITLHESLVAGKMENFFESMHRRGINYLLIVKTSRPLYGDAWGYAVTLPSTAPLHASLANIVYSDYYFQLFQIPPARNNTQD